MFGLVKSALFWQRPAIDRAVPFSAFLLLLHVNAEIFIFQILSTSLPHFLDMDATASKG